MRILAVNAKVSEFVDHDTKWWNTGLLKAIFMWWSFASYHWAVSLSQSAKWHDLETEHHMRVHCAQCISNGKRKTGLAKRSNRLGGYGIWRLIYGIWRYQMQLRCLCGEHVTTFELPKKLVETRYSERNLLSYLWSWGRKYYSYPFELPIIDGCVESLQEKISKKLL